MTSEEQEFHRDFQRAAFKVARLYSSAYTAMEIEMGSVTAPLLAPHILQTIVASAQQVALDEAQERARQAFEKELLQQEAAAGNSEAEGEYRNLLGLAQVLEQGRPW